MPTLTADASGNGTVTLTGVPVNLPSGARTLRVVGNQGTVVKGVYTASPTPLLLTGGLWPSKHIVSKRYEPIAQTFTLDESRMIGGIEVEIAVIGTTTKPMRIQIRETIGGIPSQMCLGEAEVARADFGNGYDSQTRFAFNPPVPLFAHTEYAFVVMSEDPNDELAYARIGERMHFAAFDQIVTQQPYAIGRLLISSHVGHWTPVDDTDLRFRILACRFDPTAKVVNFGHVSASVTDFKVMANVWRPFGLADVQFGVTPENGLGVGTELIVTEGTPVRLATSPVGQTKLRAYLTGDDKSSAIIAPNPQLAFGSVRSAGSYVSKKFPAATNYTAVIVVNTKRAPGSTLRFFMAITAFDDTGVDELDGDAPDAFETPSVNWAEFVDQTGSMVIEEGWTEEVFQLTGLSGIGIDQLTRVRIHMTGTITARPKVQNLRVVLSPI